MKLAIPGGGHRLINDYDFMAETLRPIKAIAHRQETCILMLHHFGKLRSAEPDVVQDALGSIAIGGTVDTLFGLYRRETANWAELGIVGRRIERQKLAIQMDTGSLRWGLFDGPPIEITDRRQEILEALESFRQADTESPGKRVKERGGPGRANVSEIAAAIEQNRGNTYTRLRELEAAGVVVRRAVGRNVYYELGGMADV